MWAIIGSRDVGGDYLPGLLRCYIPGINQDFDTLIQHIERLNASGEEPTTELTIVLEGTFNLLKNRIFALFNFAKYNDYVERLKSTGEEPPVNYKCHRACLF